MWASRARNIAKTCGVNHYHDSPTTKQERMKIARAALMMLALPVSLAAQQPQPGPSANPVTASFRGRILNLHRNLAQAFDSIPESLFSYKPTPAQLTVGYVAQHLANDNYLFCNTFGDMKNPRTPEETSTPDSLKAKWPKAKLVAQLKASFAFCEQAFGQLEDAKLGDQVSVSFGANTRNVTRSAMVIGHAMDLADHYSQIANYMRLNNMLPPTALPRPRPAGN
jgi:hypothetical protein